MAFRVASFAAWVLLAGAPRLEAQSPAPAITEPAADNVNSLAQIEVKAPRKGVEKRVRAFIAAVTPQIYSDSLLRWNKGICPQIVGPPPDQTARILSHVSQIAAAAGVVIQPQPCTANLYIIASTYPELLLNAWGKRDHPLFGGTAQKTINAFINTPRPVRVWYNTVTVPREDHPDIQRFGERTLPTMGAGSIAESPANVAAANVTAAIDAARTDAFLNFREVQSFKSVIVVVDTKRAAGVTLDQLADYIALVGLSKVNLDMDLSGAPTILSIFAPSTGSAAQPAPASITGWDQDYLKALYLTRQSSRRQRSEIADMMVRDMVK
jgi:hypothetical protein